jgi:hypothetical protein
VLTPGSALPDKAPFIPPISGQQRSGSSINIKPLAQVRREQIRPQSSAIAKVEEVSDEEVNDELDTTAKEQERSDEEPTPPPSPNTLRNKRLALYGKRPATSGEQ